MQPSRFQRFVEYLLDNLFDIVTIMVAGRRACVPRRASSVISAAIGRVY
jgi:hypothetical protein